VPDPAPEPQTGPEPAQAEAPGLAEQFGRTRRAFMRMVSSHFRLLSAELSEIMDEIKRAIALLALAAVLLLLAAVMVTLGTILWLDEWAFGSIGWGVLHGSGLLISLSVIAALVVLPNSGGRLGAAFFISLVVAVVAGAVFWLRLTNQAFGWLGDSFFGSLAWPDGNAISNADRPVVVAVIVLAVLSAAIAGLLGLLAGEGALDRLGSAVGGAIVGGLVGGLLGGLLGVPMSWGCAVAAGLAVFLFTLPILALVMVLPNADWGEFKKRLMPNQTIETTKETIEWAREQMPLGRKS
jgi:hypothetical protein